MIKLELLEQDGTVASSTEWADSEARQMAAFRMRWLRPRGNHGPRVPRSHSDGRLAAAESPDSRERHLVIIVNLPG